MEKTVEKCQALFRSAKMLANETQLNVNLTVKKDDRGGSDSWLNVGDYDFCSYWDGNKQINYVPKGDKEHYVYDVDPETIVSLTEPPVEKSPATGQSTQGTSVQNNAHPYTTTSGEVGQA